MSRLIGALILFSVFEVVTAFARQNSNVSSSATDFVLSSSGFTNEAAQVFDQLWAAFDKDYAMFVIRPEVDWPKQRDKYRPLALTCTTVNQLAQVCAETLRPLRDLHAWLTVSNTPVPVFDRPRIANANPRGIDAVLRPISREQDENDGVRWAVTTNHIGYIAIYVLAERTAATCDIALEKMRDTRGLIVDVRLNGGGAEPVAKQIAGRFVEKDFVYASSRFRNGPNHSDLTEKFPRTVSPCGPWRYDRPVLLLIGQKCMSSAESFVGMMTGATNVTTFGDHTCGSSGNPKTVGLPLGMEVNVPQWIDYLPDGPPLDEHGFMPQIQFVPQADSFNGRDDLLSAALEKLGHEPLPDHPIGTSTDAK